MAMRNSNFNDSSASAASGPPTQRAAWTMQRSGSDSVIFTARNAAAQRTRFRSKTGEQHTRHTRFQNETDFRATARELSFVSTGHKNRR